MTLHLVLYYKDLFKLTAIAHDTVHEKDNHTNKTFSVALLVPHKPMKNELSTFLIESTL